MSLFKNRYRTESNRLKNWDYSSEAIYFITFISRNRECIFGVIENDKMVLSDKGKIIEKELLKSITIRERWFFHNWVIMPNSISSFVATFKSVMTKQINELMENKDGESVWQSNYHDHIVRNYNSFDTIYHYIKNNPKNWNSDSINID